jgi:hypothetical protein
MIVIDTVASSADARPDTTGSTRLNASPDLRPEARRGDPQHAMDVRRPLEPAQPDAPRPRYTHSGPDFVIGGTR